MQTHAHTLSLLPFPVQIDSRQYPVTVHFNKRTTDDYIADAYRKVTAYMPYACVSVCLCMCVCINCLFVMVVEGLSLLLPSPPLPSPLPSPPLPSPPLVPPPGVQDPPSIESWQHPCVCNRPEGGTGSVSQAETDLPCTRGTGKNRQWRPGRVKVF